MQYWRRRIVVCPLLLGSSLAAVGQSDAYPHNAVTCERCHNEPSRFGGSSMTVLRTGSLSTGRFDPAIEGGIHHRHGESAQSSDFANQISGERVSISLLGDGYIEAIDGSDIVRIGKQQRDANQGETRKPRKPGETRGETRGRETRGQTGRSLVS
jgi:hypothetical protein